MDVLIANAGVLLNDSITEGDPFAWWHTFEVNLRGSYACVRACLPGMLQRGAGTIICMSSAPSAEAAVSCFHSVPACGSACSWSSLLQGPALLLWPAGCCRATACSRGCSC